MQFSWSAAANAQRPRLDRFLAECELDRTRSQIKRLIESGDVEVQGRVITKPGYKLSPGDAISVTLQPLVEPRAIAQDIPLDVLYEDADIIVVDKPAGLVVHPAPGHPDGTLVNALLAHCGDLSGIGGQLRPGIVHRLDKDTSGVMVATKNDRAHNALAALFKEHDLTREYLAVVGPAPPRAHGTFDTWHNRHPSQRRKFSSRVKRGKRAVTHYWVERRYGTMAALVRCRLETGRTHQIRVHFTDHGWPLMGDPMYGRLHRGSRLADLSQGLGRQALHARLLELRHPRTGEVMRWQSEPPADIQQLMAELERRAL